MACSDTTLHHGGFSRGELNPTPNLRHARVFGAEELKEANIASHLGPRARRHISEGARMRVVGFDGYSVDLDTYEWRPEWLPAFLTGNYKDGTRPKMSVDYLLQRPLPGVIEKLQRFAVGLPPESARLRIFVPNDAAQVPPHWDRFHFAVFENQPQLWIEGNHPPLNTNAYDCYYFEPEIALNEPLYYSCLKEFDDVTRDGCEVAVDSQALATALA